MLLHLPRMEGYGKGDVPKNGPALAGHGAETVHDAIAGTIMRLPAVLRRSLTWDQGAEMAQHAQLQIDTGLEIYFCDPQSPWQHGSNENTNRLLRQCFPKGTDLSQHGFKVSMSGKGNCYDNSMVETFFKSIKAELIWRNKWDTRRQSEGAIFQYINGFYNPRRHHSSLGGKFPWPSN